MKQFYPCPSKYKATKVTVNGIAFDSKREARRYEELQLLQIAGRISDLKLQQEYELIPAQYEPSETKKRGRLIERPVKYRADFTYHENGKLVVEDTKGVRTKDYIIKRKLMLWVHGIRIKEV